MAKEKIVVIEDEADILEILLYNLRKEHYQVSGARDGAEGLEQVRKESPQLILLDLMLPGMDGIEICRQLKADPVTRAIPIIMVTAKGEESDVVVGLSVGADDYIKKPFSPRELMARVRAVLRRGPLKEEKEARTDRIERGEIILDASRHEVRAGGAPVVLTATEFRLLHYLASYPGRVFTRAQLMERVLGEDALVIDRNIDVHIRSIRGKLGEQREWVETIRGVGYRFKDERDG